LWESLASGKETVACVSSHKRRLYVGMPVAHIICDTCDICDMPVFDVQSSSIDSLHIHLLIYAFVIVHLMSTYVHVRLMVELIQQPLYDMYA
jgi:hypothetical protein